jgi:hypothetical protein
MTVVFSIVILGLGGMRNSEVGSNFYNTFLRGRNVGLRILRVPADCGVI